MLRKTLALFLLLLASCTPAPVPTPIHILPPPHVFREDDSPQIKAFRPSATCPNICWMGIHPGTTDAGQAVALLKGSSDIQEMDISEKHILAKWFPGLTHGASVGVLIELSNGSVKSISLDTSYSQTGNQLILELEDWFSLVGEPQEVEASNRCIEDCGGMQYLLYFSTLYTALKIKHGNASGPAAHDYIGKIKIGVFRNELPEFQYLQPWLGYGHRTEYLQRGFSDYTDPLP